MASRPRPSRGLPHGFMQHHREGMAGSPACPPSVSPRLKPPPTQPHSRRRRRASLASTTRRPQHRSSSRFALRALRVDPAPRPTPLQNRRPPSKNAQTNQLTAPPRSGMALPLDSHVERQVTWSGTSCDRRSPPEVADSPRRRRFMVLRMVPSRRPTGPATLRNRCVCPVARSPAISAPRADEASAEGEPVAGSLRMHRQRTPLRHNTGRTPCRCKSREQAAHSRGQPD